MRKIKVAQIGISYHSHGITIIKAMRDQPELFDVVGYALPENEREKFPDRMSVFDGLPELAVDEILNNPEIEAVAVETEEIYLTKYATLAAEHGKHIHMEKPGGTDPVEFEKLINIVKKNKTVFHTGYMYRYNPYITELIKRIKDGEIGDVISVEAQMSCVHQKEMRDWLTNFPGGMMFFLGCHLIDLILQIQGEPERVIPLCKSSGVGGALGDDYTMAVFEYKNGVSFAKTSAVEPGGFMRRQLVVSGSKGTVEIRPIERVMDDVITTDYREVYGNDWFADSEFKTTEPFHRYNNMMASFAQMVRGEKENPWDYDYELMLYKYVLKACGQE